MMRAVAMLLLIVALAGCRGHWVEEVSCPGGRVDVEKRTIDTIAGRTRNTVVRTNACLE